MTCGDVTADDESTTTSLLVAFRPRKSANGLYAYDRFIFNNNNTILRQFIIAKYV